MKAGAEAVRELRVAREKRGLTFAKIQADTRIPAAHIQALEEGRFDDIPKGPFREGYWKSYRGYLGLDTSVPLPVLGLSATPVPERRTQGPANSGPAFSEPPLPRPPKPALIPLSVVRVIAFASALTLFGVVAWRTRAEGLLEASPAAVTAPVVGCEPDQSVSVVAQVNSRVRVVVDGEVKYDGAIPGGKVLKYEGCDEVEVGIAAAEQVKVTYNKQAMLLPGRQDEPRTLRFIDDRGATP